MRAVLPFILLIGLVACGAKRSGEVAVPAAPHVAAQGSDAGPQETAPPNAAGQHPAFPGQTRAPALTTNTRFQVQTVAKGLDHPWGIAFLPDGRALVTERVGRMRILDKTGQLSPPLAGLPKVETGAQAGLFGLALDPAFAKTGLVYFAFMEARPSGLSGLSVARGRLVETGGKPALQGAGMIFRAEPAGLRPEHRRAAGVRPGRQAVRDGGRPLRPRRPAPRPDPGQRPRQGDPD